ncbi:hypothetical protein [Actinoplanes sp. DH11]|uniref:hypothetical protein n=1 Tax=Actinoplanes sp. DH11 TaxID=2857011 RepID=UPI001E3B69F6|nr:hypothetical protein [Actinoplanes sp. DH11]
MSATVTIILIVVALLVLAAIVLGVRAARRRKLQQTFGPEYDRVVADTGNRTEAERELHERTKRHAQLELRELSEESRTKYAAAWEEVQIRFVDNPKEAVATADELVTALIAERGYPTGDYDDRLANLSVEHAATLEHYRAAHEISRRSRNDETETEDLRQALVHYRALFADLLGENPIGASTPAPRPAADDSAPADAPGRTVTDTEDTATESGVARPRPDAASR